MAEGKIFPSSTVSSTFLENTKKLVSMLSRMALLWPAFTMVLYGIARAGPYGHLKRDSFYRNNV